MNIVQITPGAGGMYCGNCFRDNALVAGLRRQGHQTLMVPLYLPMTLDEADESAGTPIFFGGVSVYLEQKSALFRSAPRWLHHLLKSEKLLRWAAGRAASTRAQEVGDLLISMLQGEHGRQAAELDELIGWLKQQPRPDVICLSNALLVGMARKLKAELKSPIVCMLQGEDAFLDSLADQHRTTAWRTLAERAADVDAFIAPSRYFGDRMAPRMNVPAERVKVVYNGISLDGYGPATNPASADPATPTLGYFARMCKDKGLDLLVAAFIEIRKHGRVPNLKLKIGGGCGPSDQAFVETQRNALHAVGLLGDVEFHPNLDRHAKIEFLRSLTVLSVPALYGEAFGLYVIEAMAAGAAVVQPRHASFPELIEATGGGLIAEPTARGLAHTIEHLLLDPAALRTLRDTGRRTVHEQFNCDHMAREAVRVFTGVVQPEKAV